MTVVSPYLMRHLLLTAVVFLLVGSFVGRDTYARMSSRDEKGDSQRVRHLLSDQQIEDLDAIKLIFKEDVSALPTLRATLREGNNVERASLAFVTLAGPKEREFFRSVIATQKDDKKKSLMSSFLAGALVQPSSDEEWRFLETCLRGYKDESPESFSAVLALGVNASPRALHLLQAVLPTDKPLASDNDVIQEVRWAIRWIERKSSVGQEVTPTKTGSDSEQIKRIVSDNALYADGKPEDLSVEDIAFTRAKNRALVSVEVDLDPKEVSVGGPKETQGYDIVLERIAGTWKIVGVWATWAT